MSIRCICHLIFLLLSYSNRQIIIISIILFCTNSRLYFHLVNGANEVEFVFKFLIISIIPLKIVFITNHVEEIQSRLKANDEIIVLGVLLENM
jgi:hypothetical protein